MTSKPEGRCIDCGVMAILGKGLCQRCWDKRVNADKPRDKYLGKKEAVSPKGVGWYVIRNGELVEATRQEFLVAISGIRHHGKKTARRIH